MDQELTVGTRLRNLRREQNLSQKDLAAQCGMSLNAISLIERDAISPNVATLQRLATALNVRMGYFFESDEQASVIYVKAGERQGITSRGVTIEGMGLRLAEQQVQPYILSFAPRSDIGSRLVTHTGHEFACCLRGTLEYEVDNVTYNLGAGDMLLFEASLPHSCQNTSAEEARLLLVLHTPDRPQDSVRWHFIDHPGVAHMG